MQVETVDIQERGGSQAIALPESFSINDYKVYLKKTVNTIQTIPYRSAWQNLEDSIDMFSKDFMNDRKQPTA